MYFGIEEAVTMLEWAVELLELYAPEVLIADRGTGSTIYRING